MKTYKSYLSDCREVLGKMLLAPEACPRLVVGAVKHAGKSLHSLLVAIAWLATAAAALILPGFFFLAPVFAIVFRIRQDKEDAKRLEDFEEVVRSMTRMSQRQD